jgi:hypothetical protein
MSGDGTSDRARFERRRPARATARGMAAAFAVALLLGACGVKSTPKFPEGSTFPQKYPTLEEKKGLDGKEGDTQLSPLGFPYEYPNRPPSR